MATAKLLDDITECPICTEVYTDPRVLPCVHTYCLKCIEAWRKEKPPGSKLACPLCRKEFTLPSNGVNDLPKNFFIANFLQVKELLSVKSKRSPCEACSGGKESKSKVQVVASVFCVECQLKLCQNCERGHKAIKLTRSHKLIAIGEKVSVETLYRSMPPSYCDQHQDKSIEIYCFDCKMALCMMCYIEIHNMHKCSDINKVHDEFRKQMSSDANNVADGIEKMREMLESLEKEKKEFIEQAQRTRDEFIEKSEQLKRMIDNHRHELMNELSSIVRKRMKEIKSLREEMEIQLMSMESYKKYVDEVRQKGTACDIARAASDLHDRAKELLKFDAIKRSLSELSHADVKFKSSKADIDDVDVTLGKLRLIKHPGKPNNLLLKNLHCAAKNCTLVRFAIT